MTMEEFYGDYPGPRFWCASLWSDEERPEDWEKIIRRANGILLEIQNAGNRYRADQGQILGKMNAASEIFWDLYRDTLDIEYAISEGMCLLIEQKEDKDD